MRLWRRGVQLRGGAGGKPSTTSGQGGSAQGGGGGEATGGSGGEAGGGVTGEVEWTEELEQPWPSVYGLTFEAIDVDEAGFPIVVGRIYHDANLGGDEVACDECADRVVARYDPDGNNLWTRKLESSSIDDFSVAGLEADATGSSYLAGWYDDDLSLPDSSLVGSHHDLFLIKLTPEGDTAWAMSAGGANVDEIRALDVTPGGEVAIAGRVGTGISVGGAVLSDSAAVDFVGRYDPSGAHVFSLALPPGFSVQSVAITDGGRTVVGGKSVGTLDLGEGTLPAEAPVVLEVNAGANAAMVSWRRYDDQWLGSGVARLGVPGPGGQWQLDMNSKFTIVAAKGPNATVYLAGLAQPPVLLPGKVLVSGHFLAKLTVP